MNFIKTLSISLLAISLAYGADGDKPKISKETQAAIDKAIDGNLISANKAYVAFRFELEKAQDKILKDLEKLKITATKAGDLDSAIAIDTQIKSVKEKGMLADRVAESGGELLGDKVDLGKAIVGKWMWTNVECTFDKKGNISGRPGTWKVDGDKITMNVNGWTMTASISEDGATISGVRNDGGKFTLTRVTDKK